MTGNSPYPEAAVANHTTFEQTTDGVRIEATPVYLEDQSIPDAGKYVWAYQIRMQNIGDIAVQLLTRRWRITDAMGRVHEVIGDGVVGDRPVLKPGEHYEYSSGTPLATPSGFMTGIFQMIDERGRRFAVNVPTFSLDRPSGRNMLH